MALAPMDTICAFGIGNGIVGTPGKIHTVVIVYTHGVVIKTKIIFISNQGVRDAALPAALATKGFGIIISHRFYTLLFLLMMYLSPTTIINRISPLTRL